jgi:hypothetical protein
MRKKLPYSLLAIALFLLTAYGFLQNTELAGCLRYAGGGLREVARERAERFLGKVHQDTFRCRAGNGAAASRGAPWIDWQHYWGAGDGATRYTGLLSGLGFLSPNRRGIAGALLDLEYQRIELLKFNLFDNSGTFEEYVQLRNGTDKPQRYWPQFQLGEGHPSYEKFAKAGSRKCPGDLVRFRTVDGICNDIFNPLMGATGQLFARNVDFANAFPDLAIDEIVKNRHDGRIGPLSPDPQIISRKLLTRFQTTPARCNGGHGLPENAVEAHCDYQKADHLNVLAAFWIQFMTHDWFSHLEEGLNDPEMMPMGCAPVSLEGADNSPRNSGTPSSGCRPGDRVGKAILADDGAPKTFRHGGESFLRRAYKTTPNKVTAWWDASQIYGYDERSRRRVKRDPRDRAKLLLELPPLRPGEALGYLPALQASDPMNPHWAGQDAVAFPDNWNIGLSFFHNLFAREHNFFVDHFRKIAERSPDADSGLRRPEAWQRSVPYKEVSDDEIFEVARLVIAAELAKIHTIEWTPQLLYNEPLYQAMNANWSGLLERQPAASAALERVMERFTKPGTGNSDWFAAFAAGPGIFGLGNQGPDIQGGIHHFGSPFNFPEEFINAYRLHALVPDLIEYRDLKQGANKIGAKIPVAARLRREATLALRESGMANWALSLGRQRAGKLTLGNHPLFLQDLEFPQARSPTGRIDIVALDILRDRERGIPRYNEFRRQYGLKQLTSFEDFIDPRLPQNSPELEQQQRFVKLLRELYGQHRCEATKIITRAQRNENGTEIDDCLGKENGSLVDNIEDVDALVGWLAEFVRPHGFAISETQFQVFILNASRRLFSDRFLTSSFRPEFYSHLGVEWVNNNGPDGKVIEKGKSNGHTDEVAPLKRVLLRAIPELRADLEPVRNVFDPWARDRGEYYSLQWKPRPGAESDESFEK